MGAAKRATVQELLWWQNVLHAIHSKTARAARDAHLRDDKVFIEPGLFNQLLEFGSLALECMLGKTWDGAAGWE